MHKLPPQALVFAPMATLVNGGVFERWYLEAAPEPEKLIFQLVGDSPDDLVAAARILAARPGLGVDLNMGCSAPHIHRHGAGIAWMTDKVPAAQLVAACRAVLPDKTLSVKLRLGEEEDPARLLEFCQSLEAAGLDFLTLHPRIRKDSLSRPSRWNHVAFLKQNLGIPVIGNGDLRQFSDYQTRQTETGADGYMVGRQACQAPWTFHLWRTWEQNPEAVIVIDLGQAVELFHQHLERWQPPEFWVTRTKRFYEYFAKNFVFGHRLAAQMGQMREYGQLRDHLQEYLAAHPAEVQRSYQRT